MSHSCCIFLLIAIFLHRIEAGVPQNASYFEQRVNHLSDDDGRTYRQRYYYNDTFFGGPGSPILVIMGGENEIPPSKGFMYPFVVQLARDVFGAALLQPEHRFYGASQPVSTCEIQKLRRHGKLDPRIELLTVEQALLDAMTLIDHVRVDLQCSKDRFSPDYCPVITFGGSYPGFLSAMARCRFPQTVDMAYAASAPMKFYAQKVDADAYYNHITKVAESTVAGCAADVRTNLDTFVQILENDGVPYESLDLGICPGTIPAYIQDTETFIQEIIMMIGYTFANLNMAYYPPSPNTSLAEACRLFQMTDSSAIDKIRHYLVMFLSHSTVSCFNMSDQLPMGPNATISAGDWSGVGTGTSGESWDFQTCHHLVETIAYGQGSMFPPREWTLDWMTKHCLARFGVPPRPLELVQSWKFDDLVGQNASHIIFTNGLNDGWSVSGIKEDLSDTLIVMNFENGAHHSELSGRWPGDRDTEDIQDGHFRARAILAKWLADLPGGRLSGKQWSAKSLQR